MANDSYSSGLLDNVDNMFNEGGLMSRGGGMLDGLFGDKLHGLVSSIGNFAGIKNSSANCLFSLAAPVAMASVGKYTAEEKLESDGLSNFLWSQKENVMAAIPSGLAGITSVFGFAKADPVADNPRQAEISSAVYNNRASVNRPARTKWMLLTFLLLVGGIVAWFILK
jgi:hypothetical protein